MVGRAGAVPWPLETLNSETVPQPTGRPGEQEATGVPCAGVDQTASVQLPGQAVKEGVKRAEIHPRRMGSTVIKTLFIHYLKSFQ